MSRRFRAGGGRFHLRVSRRLEFEPRAACKGTGLCGVGLVLPRGVALSFPRLRRAAVLAACWWLAGCAATRGAPPQAGAFGPAEATAEAPPPLPPPPPPPGAEGDGESAAANPSSQSTTEARDLVEVGRTAERKAVSPLSADGPDSPVRYQVATFQTPPDVYMLALMRDTGTGVIGASDGSVVRVDFADGSCGPGWIDSAGALQAVIHAPREPAAGGGAGLPQEACLPSKYAPSATDRVFEMRDGAWFELKSALRVKTRQVSRPDGTKTQGKLMELKAKRPKPATRSLAGYLGFALGSESERRVRVELPDGAFCAGMLGRNGKLAIESLAAWEPKQPSARAPDAAASSGTTPDRPECSNKLCIAVEARVLGKVRALGDDVVFFTSKQRPIRSLAEITETGTQLGLWGVELLDGTQQLFETAGVKLGAGGKGLARVLGDAYFPELFVKNPGIRFFVTHRYDDSREAAITKQGGGVQVVFVPK